MLDLLRSLEWCAPFVALPHTNCPACGKRRENNHAPDCRLDRAIRELASGESEPTRTIIDYLTPYKIAIAQAAKANSTGEVLPGYTDILGSEPPCPHHGPVKRPLPPNNRVHCQACGATWDEVGRRVDGEPTVDEPIRVGSLVCPKPAPYKGTVWRVDRIERGRAYMTRVDQPDASCTAEAVFPVGDVVAVEPTVDEMARDLGWRLESSDTDHWWADAQTGAVRLSRETISAEWEAFEDTRRWGKAADAIRTLYREHKAKQGRLVIDPASPMLNEPPTDPSALAAWLYARVVPGRTVVEHGRAYKVPVETVTLRSADVLVETRHACITIPGGDFKHLRLLNPDGTVLWEAT